ncbi:unnamed protein product, partial [Porites lobata]
MPRLGMCSNNLNYCDKDMMSYFARFRVVFPFPVVPLLTSHPIRSFLFPFIIGCPKGASVNDGICKDFYLGEPPTSDPHLSYSERIVQFGPGCLLFKRNLKRAYIQLPVDPYDYPLLG